MAITKERLEELVKEGATIYWLAGEMVLNIHLDSSYYVSDANILCHKKSEDEKNCVEHIENLYETQKQAEWHLNYHATRTEELDLPTWEEIKDIKGVKEYTIANPIGICFFLNFHLVIPQIVLVAKEDLYNWNLTEENYIKACDLCLKLFKGEEV